MPRHLRTRTLGVAVALAACSILPISSAIASSDGIGEAKPAPAALPEADPEGAFDAVFAPLPEAELEVAADVDAVDLAAFDPPIEVEQAPALRTLGTGIASYYGRRFHGRRTANGERFDMNALTAAHKTLPFGTRVEVTNPRTGKAVTVRINDRGPFTPGRTIDLSRAAAERIGIVARGHGKVELALIDG